jgi:hypothetical protein
MFSLISSDHGDGMCQMLSYHRLRREHVYKLSGFTFRYYSYIQSLTTIVACIYREYTQLCPVFCRELTHIGLDQECLFC